MIMFNWQTKYPLWLYIQNKQVIRYYYYITFYITFNLGVVDCVLFSIQLVIYSTNFIKYWAIENLKDNNSYIPWIINVQFNLLTCIDNCFPEFWFYFSLPSRYPYMLSLRSSRSHTYFIAPPIAIHRWFSLPVLWHSLFLHASWHLAIRLSFTSHMLISYYF